MGCFRSLRSKAFKAETSQPRRAHLTRVLSLCVDQTMSRAARFALSADSLGVVRRELMSRVVIEDSYQRNARLGGCV